ncbi:MAG TPA: flagellar biosynthesis protein FlhF, partial [Ideonella sp.]|nr:flagellar biosynthesis protein FlhF [Ideonella sp.]
MNVKRFTARTSREAFVLVRQAFGEDAVVLSTRPSPEGVEVLAMAPGSVEQLERMAQAPDPHELPPPRSMQSAARQAAPAPAPAARSSRGESLTARVERQTPDRPAPGKRLADRIPSGATTADVASDVEQLAMSTLSFQDYVRERMLKRRQAALNPEETPTIASEPHH